MLEFSDYAIAFALIAFAGFVDSIAGGGGLITVPTYLFLGLPPQILLGTNKLVSTIGSSLSIFRYTRAKAIQWKLFRVPVAVSFLAAIFGAWLSRYQSKELMLGILLVVSPLVFVISLRRPKPATGFSLSTKSVFIFLISIAALLGTYDGFFGPGTGSFFLFGLLYILRYSPKDASANARVLNYASNLGALSYFFSQLQFSYHIAAIGIVASLLGNYIGSHFVIHHAAKIVRPLFLIVLIGLMTKLIFDFF